ncbi:hypothetical protein BVRB_5g100660 [Beta vulgaris subsp. vulgaris]|nr:hypothetical protein BVRB_5g100660 [Beta vulgaris subsp. vulgaris]
MERSLYAHIEISGMWGDLATVLIDGHIWNIWTEIWF